MISDILLCRIALDLPDVLVRAYADDTAVVTKNIFADKQKLLKLYKQFGDLSGLKLNLPKTVVLPLTDTLPAWKKKFRKNNHHWQKVEVALSSKYLGYEIGPGSPAVIWKASTAKFQKRCILWSKVPRNPAYI